MFRAAFGLGTQISEATSMMALSLFHCTGVGFERFVRALYITVTRIPCAQKTPGFRKDRGLILGLPMAFILVPKPLRGSPTDVVA